MFGTICDNDFHSQRGREKLRSFYLQHYQNVKQSAAGGELLNYSVQDGWEPLCEFLYEQAVLRCSWNVLIVT